MADITFEDNRIEIEAAMNDAITAFLYEEAGELVSAIASASPVDTGDLKGSWTYEVDESTGTATVGSPLENAIWNEFGTGEYALKGDGRKGGWAYQDASGEYHHTYGKIPNRSMEHAFNANKDKIIKRAEQIMKESLSD